MAKLYKIPISRAALQEFMAILSFFIHLYFYKFFIL